jgi:hypothetical protein
MGKTLVSSGERVLVRSAAAIGLLIVCVCASEYILRVVWDGAYLTPPIFQRAQLPQSYALRANARVLVRQFGRTVAISTTSVGTRIVVGSPPSAPHVVHVVGDSQAFGWGLSDEETVGSRLQVALGSNAVVVNHGVPGYGPIQYALVLRTLPVEDFVVVLHTEENDAADSFSAMKADEVTCGFVATTLRTEGAIRCALMRLRSVQAVLGFINDFQHRYNMTPLGFSEYSEVAGSVMQFRIAHLYDQEQQRRAGRLLFTVVPWKGRYSAEWRRTYAPPPRQDAAFMRTPFTDDFEMVENMRERSEMYIDGDTHLSPAGADVVGRLVAAALQPLLLSAEIGGIH